MRRLFWITLLIGAWALVPSSLFAADKMKPGLWEITTSMEMPGMPMEIPAQTIRQCYTAEDIAGDPVPTSEGCQMTDLKTSGNKTSWKVDCKGEMEGQGEGQITFLNDSTYEGYTRLETQGMTMEMKYVGKRLGDCE